MSYPKESKQNTNMSVDSHCFKTIKWRCTIDNEEYVSTIVVTKYGYPLIYATDVSRILTCKKRDTVGDRNHFISAKNACSDLKLYGILHDHCGKVS